MIVIYCNLERENYKNLRFHLNNSAYCEINDKELLLRNERNSDKN